MPDEADLNVAVTGPTGTFGYALMPVLEAEARVKRVVGVARRPFDPALQGWAKMEYRQGDVRDRDGLCEAFKGADVVVHLAFMITGAGGRAATRAVNVEGTLNALRAARDVGARRFVYASSIAAYGFHADNPVGMSEEWPTRPADHLFYAQEKAEIEQMLAEDAAASEGPDLYLLRPPVVLGPHTVGGKGMLLDMLMSLGRRLSHTAGRLPIPVPALVPDLPIQLIHEDDVAQALLRCLLGAGLPGTYNIAADDTLALPDIARELGLTPVPVPAGPVGHLARAVASSPGLPPTVEWAEVLSRPSVMSTAKAKQELAWQPRHTALDALRETLTGD